mgnify:CR=1 FL=1
MDFIECISGTHPQSTAPVKAQLIDLIPVAEKLGLSKAADFLKNYAAASDNRLKNGQEIWYVDFDDGLLEKGMVCNSYYQDGRLESFAVEFENGDFDEFLGRSYGNTFFSSKEAAESALLCGGKVEKD